MVIKDTVGMQFKVGISGVGKVVDYLIQNSTDSNIWLFNGDLGSGKTYLISKIASSLGVLDAVSSPTYSIVNEYSLPDGKTLYHFDFYRIQTKDEALNIGLIEYLESGHKCFIEWPKLVNDYLPLNCIEINISHQEDDKRLYSILKHE